MILSHEISKGRTICAIRPDKLAVGMDYLLIENTLCGSSHNQELVRFVEYTNCPGTVIVQDGNNQRLIVARDRLFISPITIGIISGRLNELLLDGVKKTK